MWGVRMTGAGWGGWGETGSETMGDHVATQKETNRTRGSCRGQRSWFSKGSKRTGTGGRKEGMLREVKRPGVNNTTINRTGNTYQAIIPRALHYVVGIISISTLQMRKLKHREVK